jgi:MFS family permease
MSARRLVLSCGALTGTFAAGYGVMFTVLDDFRNEYGISPGWLGAVVAVGFFTSFLAQVLIAPMADRGHAKRLVMLGILAEVVGLVLMAVGTTVTVMIVARLVMGLGAGMALPALRRIVIVADPANLGGNVGTLLAADVAGFAAGPLLSVLLLDPFGIGAPFLAIAAVTAAFAPLVARLPVAEGGARGAAGDEVHADGALVAGRPAEPRFAFDLLRHRPYVSAVCIGSGVFYMIGAFDALWAIVLDDLGTADWIANLGIVLFAVPMFFLGSVGGRLAQRVGPFRVGTLGLFAGACFLVAYGSAPSGMVIFAVSMVHAISDGLTVSSAGVAVGLVAPADRQAGAQGLLGGAQTLTGGVAALVAGWLYDAYGRGVSYGVATAVMLCLVVAARWLAGPAYHDRRPLGEPVEVVATH